MAGTGHLWATDEAPSVGDALVIASGAAGLRQIKRIPTNVLGRDQGRPNWTRERFCAVALIRHLFEVRQHFFRSGSSGPIHRISCVRRVGRTRPR